MKLLFILFFITLFTYCSTAVFSQSNLTATPEPDTEELRREILQMKEESRQMQLHFHRAHREFRTGSIFYAVGLGLSVLAAGSENTAPGLILLGGGFLITGGVLHIDSHKHIGRAGLVEYRR